MTKLIILALVTTLAGAGCVLDTTQPEDEQLDTTEQSLSAFLTSPTNYYYTSGGTTWFQDSYSGKWCTGAWAQAAVWDYNTTCNWNGWLDTNYNQYCTNGSYWQNKYYHYHCP